MQQIQYFKSAWGDIKNSPGWFGKLCLLALLNFIPIFGQIVTFGYLYGWAREIAWGTHEPLPERIFDNSDGKLYRRGWFVIVLAFVFSIVPIIIMQIGTAVQGLGMAQTFFGQRFVANSAWIGVGGFVSLLGMVCALFVSIFAWIGNMRIAIYDRLSAGFQLGKVWKMFRHDTGGIMRIFGMNLLFSLIIGFVLSIVIFILVMLVVSIGVSSLIGAGYSIDAMQYMSNAQSSRMAMQFLLAAGPIGFVATLVAVFFGMVAGLFVYMLVIRALGYWTMQFDVPLWNGQDDPMPFELLDDQRETPSPAPSQPPAPSAQPQSEPEATAPAAPAAPAVPVAPIAPVEPAVPAVPVEPAPSEEVAPSADPEDEAPGGPAAESMPEVEYTKPAVVGAQFIMSQEEIDELELEAQAQANETVESEAAERMDDSQ